MIPFNKPALVGGEVDAVHAALVTNGHTAGGGAFGRRCEELLQAMLGQRTLLVTSATHALELGAALLEVGPGDEVILPSFTFVSTANAFALRGAALRFADVDATGNLSLDEVARLLSLRTKCVVPVHYAGASCDLDALVRLVGEVPLLEDAAQAIAGTYRGRPLGTVGALGAISFHETKNVGCGEGGALTLRDARLIERAEYYRDKGTNRRRYLEGLVDKYTWVDLGSSLALSDLSAAVLSCQLERLEAVQARRRAIWTRYQDALASPLEARGARHLKTPTWNGANWHLFGVLFAQASERVRFTTFMRERGICTPFHYVSLHESPFGARLHDGRALPMTQTFAANLARLPLYYDLADAQVDEVIGRTLEFLQTL